MIPGAIAAAALIAALIAFSVVRARVARATALPPAPGPAAPAPERPLLFEPFTIKGVTFKNRLLRSSIGGRTAFYDGTVTSAWKNFERRFAEGGVAGLISATITVDERRLSPLEYPSIAHDRYIPELADAVRRVQALGARYILQIGDPGYHTQMSLFSQPEDGRSSSEVFDLLYGYRNHSVAMTEDEIAAAIRRFGDGARRVRAIGADGLEITASKGYLIHQFLNPGVNRRTDGWGGTVEKRFRFLREVVSAARAAVGPDFLFGIRLSAIDYNYLPLNLRLPIVFPLRHYLVGNGLEETLWFARELEKCGVDYLHITRGYGFPSPKETPGDFPIEQVGAYLNFTRFLSGKARFRAALFNLLPRAVSHGLFGLGWRPERGETADFAHAFKRAVSIPIISNGGYQDRDVIEAALGGGKCDLVSMARPLLANPDLLQTFAAGKNLPDRPCTFCNRCAVATTVFPLGCYDLSRFASQDEMEQQILRWSATHDETPRG